jgi:hypothetical protein
VSVERAYDALRSHGSPAQQRRDKDQGFEHHLYAVVSLGAREAIRADRDALQVRIKKLEEANAFLALAAAVSRSRWPEDVVEPVFEALRNLIVPCENLAGPPYNSDIEDLVGVFAHPLAEARSALAQARKWRAAHPVEDS